MATTNINPVDPAAWAAQQPPNDIITVVDRRIRVAGGGLEDASIYNYSRQWAYNHPNPFYSGPLDDPAQLPPLQPSTAEPAPFNSEAHSVGDAELKDFTEISEKQQSRWKAAGAHMRQSAADKRAPYLQRLQAAMRPIAK